MGIDLLFKQFNRFHPLKSEIVTSYSLLIYLSSVKLLTESSSIQKKMSKMLITVSQWHLHIASFCVWAATRDRKDEHIQRAETSKCLTSLLKKKKKKKGNETIHRMAKKLLQLLTWWTENDTRCKQRENYRLSNAGKENPTSRLSDSWCNSALSNPAADWRPQMWVKSGETKQNTSANTTPGY